jgi:hypothetical protein
VGDSEQHPRQPETYQCQEVAQSPWRAPLHGHCPPWLSRHMFGCLQQALFVSTKLRVSLKKGVHQALDDFRWLATDLQSRPTHIAELVPLCPAAEGHHDASGAGAGGAWFPSNSLTPREGWLKNSPVVWQLEWQDSVRAKLVSSDNPIVPSRTLILSLLVVSSILIVSPRPLTTSTQPFRSGKETLLLIQLQPPSFGCLASINGSTATPHALTICRKVQPNR